MKSKHVLFFDDEPFLTNMLIENLQRNYGWDKDNLGEISFVDDPKELFDRATNSSITYDLFVLDIMVPIDRIKGMDIFSDSEIEKMQEGDNTGIVFAERIRKMSNYQDVPILLLSARMRPSKLMDKTNYLEKPVFASDISTIMKTMMNI